MNDNDKAYMTNLLDNVFYMKCYDRDIVKTCRLGRWSEDSNAVRPLLVGFRQLEMKENVMRNLHQLKEADQRFRGVSISHDLTPKQREEIKRLLADANREHAANNSGGEENIRFIVVGQGQRRRVIKVKKQA